MPTLPHRFHVFSWVLSQWFESFKSSRNEMFWTYLYNSLLPSQNLYQVVPLSYYYRETIVSDGQNIAGYLTTN